ATARPARLDRPIWLNTPASPPSAASGAAARLVGSTEASVLIAGAASVQPCGTDMLPTRAALPMAPDTCPAPTAELSIGFTALGAPGSAGTVPEMAFGPVRYAAAPCPFCPQA